MMKARYLIIIGIISTCIWLVVKFPASILVQQITQQNPKIKVENVDGTIWNAKLSNVFFETNKIDSIDFKLTPLQLLLTNVSFDTKITKGESQIFAKVTRKSSNSYQIKNLVASIALNQVIEAVLKQLQLIFPIPLQATLTTNFENIEINKFPKQVFGSIVIKNIFLDKQKISAHTVIKFASNETKIIGKIIPQKNQDLNLKGEVILDKKGNYQAKFAVAINEKTNVTLRGFLLLSGINLETPEKEFNYSGKLSPINLP